MNPHHPAITILKLEIGRLKCCAVTPQWAAVRKRVLERCASAEKTVAFLEGQG